MSDDRYESFTVETAGFGGQETLTVYPHSSTGSIKDGVGFCNNNNGGWLISFEALKEIYEKAKKARGLK